MAAKNIVISSEPYEDEDGLPHPYTSEHSFATSTTSKKVSDDYDNGHAWKVAFAGFLTQMLIFGSVLTFGVYFVAYQEAFPEHQPNVILWIGSLAYGIMFLTGPLSSMIISRIGTFYAMLLSASLVTLGYLTSYFAQDPYHLFFTFGVFIGLGFSIAFLSSFAILNDYFKTHLRIAQIIITVGGGVGIFIFSAVNQFLINEYGWRGSMLINAGLYANFFVFALMMKPRPRDLSVKRMTMRKMMAVHVLFNKKFQLFLLHVVAWNIGFMIIFSLLNSYFVENGLTPDEAALIGMVIGILNAIGRIVSVPLERVVDPKKTYMAMTVLMGLFEMLIVTGGSFFGYTIPASIAGFAFGIMICYLVPTIGELVGFENITPALGYSNFSQGVSGLLSPVLLALIGGGSKFVVGGVITVISGILVGISVWTLLKERATAQNLTVNVPANGVLEFKNDEDGGRLLNSSGINTAIV